MEDRRPLAFVFGCLASTWSCAGPPYPDIPAKSLPTIRALPTSGPLILDVRSTPLSGDSIPSANYHNVGGSAGDRQDLQVGVFDLSEHTESIWDVPHGIPLLIPFMCNRCTMRASWASSSRKLLIGLGDDAYLVDEQGRYEKLPLQLPGVSLSFDELDQFAVTADATVIMFRVNARDRGDKYSDASDPLAARGGRLYDDLMYENSHGSKPKEFAKVEVLLTGNGDISGDDSNQFPSWSQDGKLVAYARVGNGGGRVTSSRLLVADAISGKVLWELPIRAEGTADPAVITEIRWSPDGKKLGFVTEENLYSDTRHPYHDTLYMVNSDGSDVRPMRVNGKTMDISAFAWAPSADALVFRSDLDAKPLCNFNLSFSFEVGRQPCRDSEHVYTSHPDGSGLMRISKDPEYLRGQLFWIR